MTSCPRTTLLRCCQNKRRPRPQAPKSSAWRFLCSASLRRPKIGFEMHGHLQAAFGPLRASLRARGEALDRIIIGGTLQGIQKSNYAAIVAGDLSVDVQLGQVVALYGLGFQGTAVQVQAGFTGQRIQLRTDR